MKRRVKLKQTNKQAEEKENPIHFKSPEEKQTGLGPVALLSSRLNLSQALLSSVNTDFIFEKQNPLLNLLQFTKAEMTSFFWLSS